MLNSILKEKYFSCKKSLSYRFKNIFLYPNIIFNLTGFGRKQQKSLNFIHSFVDKVYYKNIFLTYFNLYVLLFSYNSLYYILLLQMIQQRQYALNKSNTAKINNENKITRKFVNAFFFTYIFHFCDFITDIIYQ